MIDAQGVYIAYQQARARYLNRPYKVPKDWDKVWAKLSEHSSKQIELLAKAFSTRWHNVNVDKYMDCGFELYGKSFLYNKFYERKILLLYIEKDKQQKRKTVNIKASYDKSNEYVLEWMNDRPHRDDISLYKQYCMMNDDGVRAPIQHYLKNKICRYMFTWLIKEKYLLLQDYEKELVPLINSQYRKIVYDVKHMLEG